MLNLDLTSQADHTRAFCAVILLVLALCAPVRTLLAQEKEHDEAERNRAFQLFADSRFTDALPVLEKLATANPTDVEIIARLGFAILANSTTIKEPEARKRARLRARSVLLRAKELGADSDLLQAVLAALPPDGSDESSFSENREADQAIREGEAAFVRGDLDKALVAYERALKLDPKLYEAPLFAGDMYYKKGQMDKAGEWYARAIAINPDRETAYRYWGNVLMAQGKTEEARLKYIEAIIADPYSRYTWENGLVRWAQRKQVRLAHPQIEQPPSSVQASEEKGQTTIIFDRKKMDQKGADYYWSFYYLTRATWGKVSFPKEYPDEKAYRHSLKEEAAALRMVAEIASRDLKAGKLKAPDSSLANLIKLYEDGLIEPYVLFARPDEGIARDYVTYRQTGRDKLRRYLIEYVASGRY